LPVCFKCLLSSGNKYWCANVSGKLNTVLTSEISWYITKHSMPFSAGDASLSIPNYYYGAKTSYDWDATVSFG